MTLAPIRSARHAVTYFERGDHADYYLTDDVCPSIWTGEGAKHLGVLDKLVDPERFKRYLDGDIAEQKIGTERNGQWQHKPGWDLQFSPSKSVSVAALVCGDQRIIEAHDRAVKDAISMLEQKAALTRVHSRDEHGHDKCDQVPTGNLLAAVFRHDTSRALDAHLHSHAVVLNATLRGDGKWRSIESRHFYTLQKEAGLAYRQSLAASLRKLGYSLERKADANFEIRGIPENLLSAYSQRRDVVDKKIAELGYTRETAPAALKEKIAHESRDNKTRIEREQLINNWDEVAKQHDFNTKGFTQSAISRSSSVEWSDALKVDVRDRLEKLVKQSIRSLSERDAVFSKAHLEKELNQVAVSYGVSAEQVAIGIAWAEEEGIIVSGRSTKNYSAQFQCWQEVDAYTTPQNILLEEKMIATMQSGQSSSKSEFTRDEIKRVLNAAEKDSRDKGFDGWTAGQKTAVRGVLASNDQFVAIQGYAGTAKTSTALLTIAAEYKKRGYQVAGMAPSASACESLADGAKLESVVTVASHLLKPLQKETPNEKKLWLVDEASLLATKDMSQLLSRAKTQQAKVVLVGDIKQLGSVQAGAAFRQLQDNGILTYKLDEIVRQENKKLLESVHHSLLGNAERALEILAEGGGRVIESSENINARHKLIVDQYLRLTMAQREKTLVIDQSREGRDQLNECMRQGLQLSGELASDELSVQRLEKLDLTKAAAQDVLSYQAEDVVRFTRAYKSKQVTKDSYWSIKSVDPSKEIIELKNDDGQIIIWNPSAWGAKAQAFRRTECSLSVGDKLIWTVNDKALGVTNGSKAMVQKIDHAQETAEVKFTSGQICTVNIHNHQSQHWNYDYVTTVHAAQGKTAENVLFHAESFRRNLSSQKALYVAISRAKNEVTVYTDNKSKLIEQIKEHVGEKQYAHEKTHQIEYDMD